jgi:hypothetical protein
VEIKAPDSALQPPDIKASSFVLFVIKIALVNHEEHEGGTKGERNAVDFNTNSLFKFT